MDDAIMQQLYNEDHALCLAWFAEHAGMTTKWPKPIREKIVATHPKLVKENIVLVTQYRAYLSRNGCPMC
jgi:hypothetical protein